ncbi:cytosol aminopeptidase-like [Bradysia coprophila]|uniref:cytosol aminopeptidase-like n=1 Tax=Bradysia coprophila TaxID=38358 RepID=UPI00187D796D|nr:cytosol aminopeptidase-like [Bradysia coprophila]
MLQLFKTTLKSAVIVAQHKKFASYTRVCRARNYSTQTDPTCARVSKGLVIGLYEKCDSGDPFTLSTIGRQINEHCHGQLTEAIQTFGLSGVVGQFATFNNIYPDYSTICVVGLGPSGQGLNTAESIVEPLENVRIAAGRGFKALEEQGCTHIYLDSMNHPEQAAEGASLASFKFQMNKIQSEKKPVPKLELFDQSDIEAWTCGMIKAEAQNRSRYMCEVPACQMTPIDFADATVDMLDPCGVTVNVRNMEWLESMQFGAMLAVAKTSCEPPVFLEIFYRGGHSDQKPVCLIGEGLTFNSGGLSIKSTKELEKTGKCSMSGAATVVSVIRAASILGLPINVVGLVPLCENMPSGMAFKPRDIVRCANGLTLAISDPRNAGVLLLADSMVHANKTYKPKFIMTLSTSTCHIENVLGGAAAGVFCNQSCLWEEIQKAGQITGDRVWQLPFWKYYNRQVVDHHNANISNEGMGRGRSCINAAFLTNFNKQTDFAHLDLGGNGFAVNNNLIGYLEKNRMSGRPTRTILQLLCQVAGNRTEKSE